MAHPKVGDTKTFQGASVTVTAIPPHNAVDWSEDRVGPTDDFVVVQLPDTTVHTVATKNLS